MADLGFPLHTVVFGQTRGQGAARDVALSDLQMNDTVFVKNELSVTAAAKVSGFVNDKIPVELLYESAPGKMTVVGRRELQATQDGQRIPIVLDYVPEVAGEYKVTVRTEGPPGDLAPANNELSTFVTVRKGGVNVLYLEGGDHPIEAKFLRRALASSPDLHIDYLWLDAQARDTRPADLATRFAPGKYDIVIIGDLDSTIFRAAGIAPTSRYGSPHGAGFMMLGGLHSYGPGGYQKTPLAELLPIRMGPLERQNFGGTDAADLCAFTPARSRCTHPNWRTVSNCPVRAPAVKTRLPGLGYHRSKGQIALPHPGPAHNVLVKHR